MLGRGESVHIVDAAADEVEGENDACGGAPRAVADERRGLAPEAGHGKEKEGGVQRVAKDGSVCSHHMSFRHRLLASNHMPPRPTHCTYTRRWAVRALNCPSFGFAAGV
jgi:hypothetical protein